MTDHHLDAKNKRLGHLASEIALILQGKNTPKYRPNAVGEERVLLKNYRLVEVSGQKADQKVYYRHTGYPGHLKEEVYKHAFARNPKTVIREAVRKMLPKNFLNQKRLKNLIFVEDAEK